MFGQSWGMHYTVGDIVYVRLENEAILAVCVAHTGDFHHQFTQILLEDKPREHANRLYLPDAMFTFSGYYVGPTIGHLSQWQVLMLSSGIEVAPLHFDQKVEVLLGKIPSIVVNENEE